MHLLKTKGFIPFGMLVLTGCLFGFRPAGPRPLQADGFTMGTTYRVIYFDEKGRDVKGQVDSLLLAVNAAISNFDPASAVSRFNESKKGIRLQPHFSAALRNALFVAEQSHGAFEPTIMPLVTAWGFGAQKISSFPDREQIDALKAFIGYRKIVVTADSVKKTDPRVQLDFGAIGQGYGADVVSRYLLSIGIRDFIVEIGGEGLASGKNLSRDADWTVGILDPGSTRENQFFRAYVRLRDRAFTTSGNYFNYRKIDGVRYGHTIDPKTGYPLQHELLSVSVFTAECAVADAWATALMVMGREKAVETLQRHPDLDALLIFSQPDGSTGTYMTPGIQNMISLEEK